MKRRLRLIAAMIDGHLLKFITEFGFVVFFNADVFIMVLQYLSVSFFSSKYILQGRFEILSLSGSFMPTENQGTRSRSGGMSVSLASPDGRVVGGGVAGLLIAASPVQVSILSLFSTRDMFKNAPSSWVLVIEK